MGESSKADSCTLHPLGMRTSERLLQPEKAQFPISVTDGGMVMLVRLEHSEKAPSPISVTDGGMVMLVRLEQ